MSGHVPMDGEVCKMAVSLGTDAAELEQLVRVTTPPEGLIVDPFCGSGSTIAAARRLGRRAIGGDNDRTIAEAAAERFRQEPLFREVT